MMFSATSLAELPQCRRVARATARAFDRARRHPSPRRRRNSSGDNEATAPQSPATNAARAGAVRATASAKKSSGMPSSLPGELCADARLIHLAGGDRLQAGQHPGAVRVAVGGSPVDAPAACVAVGASMPAQATAASVRRKGFRTTRFRRGPGAARSPSSRRRPRGCAVALRRRRRPDRTGSRSSRRRPRRRRRPGGREHVPRCTWRAVHRGAMTAREPNQSPISAAGGGQTVSSAAAATARSTVGASPSAPEPVDPHLAPA